MIPPETAAKPPANAAFERKIALSRAALGFERAWPYLWLPAAVIAVFLLVSLAGIWPLLSELGHMALLAGLALVAAGSLIPLARLSWPSRQEALQRLETQSGMPHRPASSYEDTLADGAQSPATSELWAAHRKRLALKVAGLIPKLPVPRTEPRDPFAVRALLVLLLAVASVAAGDVYRDRLSAAFRFGPLAPAVPTRLDAWVTPPSYSGQQPILLTGNPLDQTAGHEASRRLEVPQGSALTVRAAGPAYARWTVQTQGSATAAPARIDAEPKPDAASLFAEFRSKLDGSATVRVNDGTSNRYTWQFDIVPAHRPVIALTQPPRHSARGSLILDYHASDDYGIAAAEAQFALADPSAAKPLKLADGTEITSLAVAPKAPLRLPRSAGTKDIKGHTSLDLASHLWAGLTVRMTLSATNLAGQTGTAEAEPFTLPERDFRNPLARALVEQRRKLALSPGDFLDVRYALDALAIAPDEFPVAPRDYLSLRSIYRQLTQTPSQELFTSVTVQLWQLALRIENGQLSQDEIALKEAEDRLAKALDEGASDAVIKQRMAELRQAIEKYLRALAQQGPKNGETADEKTKELSPQDLEQMLKQMEQMSQTGNKDAAQQMLAQLRDLLDRLQAGKMAKGGQNGQGGQLRALLDKFGNLIGKQRKLLDDTYNSSRNRRNGGQPGQGQSPPQGDGSGSGGSEGLGQRQGQLRDELDQLMKGLKGAAGDQSDALGQALQSMDDASGALQNDDRDTATTDQGKALEQLRKGAQAMAEKLAKGQNQNGRGQAQRDPLGRQTGQDSSDENGLNEDGSAALPLDGKDVQRSREIIEELRRRLGETTRPPGELDYLERLLK